MPGGWEWLIIVGVLILLFGAKRLPDMARSVGQSARVFKGEMKGLKSDDEAKKPDVKTEPSTVLPPVQSSPQEPARATQPDNSTSGQ